MKKVLDFDAGDYLDFKMIGIVCAYKDFRVCYEINKALTIYLRKEEDFEIKTERNRSHNFSLYNYVNEDGEQYLLISNKSGRGTLIKELKHFDYFIVIKNLSLINSVDQITDQLKKIVHITSISKLNPVDYKSSENLLLIDI